MTIPIELLDGASSDAVDKVMGLLDFCTCGDPEAALRFLRDSLNFIVSKNADPEFPKNLCAEFFNPWIERWEKERDKVFGSKGCTYFMYYFLHREGLTEHGGQVPGWLSSTGADLLVFLNKLIEKLDAEKAASASKQTTGE